MKCQTLIFLENKENISESRLLVSPARYALKMVCLIRIICLIRIYTV